MNILLVENLTKSYGIRILFRNITFGIQKGQKVALIARNGTGKTTLLNIIAGKDQPDDGKVVIRNGVTVGFLSQEPQFNPELTIWQAMFVQESPALNAIHNYEKALSAFEKSKTGDTEKNLSISMQEMDRLNAWDFESRLKQILSRLKITDTEAKINSLSGGQLKRVALAAVLINEPDLLILDEPTNHLDIDMIEWLEDFLSTANTTLLMVTHDRYFLDNVCTDIYEMDGMNIFQYNGNYEYFLQKKAEREANQESEVDKAKNLFYRELEWVRRMPKARSTKSKSRLDAFDEIKEKAFSLRKKREIEITMRMKRMGSKILELIKVSKSYGDKKLMDKFTYSFRKGERIGIVGENGSGKSTFLKMLTGKIPPDAGKISVGETIEFGFYDQMGMNLKEDKRVIEVVKDIAEVIDVDRSAKVTASQLLQRFDFPPEMQYTFVSKLSGGEKRRLYLLTVLLQNPNFLILDEPTNDLDILTLNKLEDFLMDYEGCLIIVSHDRYFMDKLVDQIFVFEGNGHLRIFGGNYTEYRIAKDLEEQQAKQTIKNIEPEKTEVKGENKIKTKLSYKEKLEFEKIEKELPELEKEREQLNEKLNSGIANHEELLKITERMGEVSQKIDTYTDRWLELSEYEKFS